MTHSSLSPTTYPLPRAAQPFLDWNRGLVGQGKAPVAARPLCIWCHGSYPVSPRVGNVKNDDAALLEPVA
jgi:hypothetical protein